MSQKFAKDTQDEFEMSFLGELTLFLGLHIYKHDTCIFISHSKYIKDMLKRFGMEYCKLVSTPMQTSCKLSKEDESKDAD
jgi:hypothetical protein